MSDQGKGEAKRPSTALNAKAASAARLPRREIAPFSRHSLIAGPKRGLSRSLRSSAVLLPAKQKAARRLKGTVGRRGSGQPSPTSPRDMKPAANEERQRGGAGRRMKRRKN